MDELPPLHTVLPIPADTRGVALILASDKADSAVRPGRRSAGAIRFVLRRIRFGVRFIYWSARHRSFEHAAWICAFEGFSWDEKRRLDEGVDYFAVEGEKARARLEAK